MKQNYVNTNDKHRLSLRNPHLGLRKGIFGELGILRGLFCDFGYNFLMSFIYNLIFCFGIFRITFLIFINKNLSLSKLREKYVIKRATLK